MAKRAKLFSFMLSFFRFSKGFLRNDLLQIFHDATQCLKIIENVSFNIVNCDRGITIIAKIAKIAK